MKFYLIALLALMAVSCKNDDSSVNDSATPPIPANVDNVEGNIPDTSRGTTLNTPMELDSLSGRDSLRR